MKAEKAELSNGMTVVSLNIPDAQAFKIILNVPVGAKHDPEGKEGLSHVLEHTVFCGTESASEVDWRNQIRAVGGDFNAFTNSDTTNFEISASSQNSENFTLICDSLRQLMTEASFEVGRIDIEKNIIVNERADGIDNLSRGPLIALTKAMQKTSGKYVDILGTNETILSVTCDDLKGFMRTNYDAGHMTLYVAGPIEKSPMQDVLEQTLSAIPNLKQAEKPEHKILLADVDIRKTRPELLQNYVSMFFASPQAKTMREIVLQNEATSHLNTALIDNLRMKRGCFYSPSGGTWTADQYQSLKQFSFSATPRDTINAFEGMFEFYKNLDDIIVDDVIQGSFNSTINDVSKTDRYEANKIYFVTTQYNNFKSLFDSENMVEILQSITPDDVRAEARRIMEGLTALHIQGPDPYTAPSLQDMQSGLNEPSKTPVIPNATQDFGRILPQQQI